MSSGLPSEILAVEGQVHNSDGRFRFTLTFNIEDIPAADYQRINNQLSTWTAGSIEELLAAIEACKLALKATPGIATTIGRPEPKKGEPRMCSRCGFEIAQQHTLKQCMGLMKAELRKQKGSGRQW